MKRIEALAGEIAKTIGLDVKGVEKARQAARLCKADLVTAMVGEFPELQGLMGRYYALDQRIDAEVADAIRDHYKPQGPSDSIPVSKVGQAVALADKLDTLVGFWAIDEKPTGSKDPYALRRAALGVVRTIVEGKVRVTLSAPMTLALIRLLDSAAFQKYLNRTKAIENVGGEVFSEAEQEELERRAWSHYTEDAKTQKSRVEDHVKTLQNCGVFIGERFRGYLKDQGAHNDHVDSVLVLGRQHDLVLITRRVEALSKFLDTDDGKNLLAGVKRASNILRIEEKKDGKAYRGDVNPSQLIKAEEKALHSAISQASALARKAVEHEDFEGAMKAIAKLRAPVDEFFEGVTVNDKDATFRENRLRLLNRIREATSEVADFSKIEG